MTDLDAIRARHVIDVGKADIYCHADGQPWPCDTAIVLAALDEQMMAWMRQRDCDHSECIENHSAAIEREARLRAALESIDRLAADWNNPTPSAGFASIQTVARAALATTPEGES